MMTSEILFNQRAKCNTCKSSHCKQLDADLRHPYSFEEALARLYSVADYNIFDEDTHDTYKCIFQLDGTFDGMYFNLYDYKRDEMIHVNYCDKMDYKLFQKTL